MTIDALIAQALKEDMPQGDRTTEALVDKRTMGQAFISAKETCVLSGLSVVEDVFRQVDPEIVLTRLASDGECVKQGQTIASLRGPYAGLLKGERVALNFLQRLSGVATATRKMVDAGKGHVVVLDTRKTTPLLRDLEKAAVVHGGGRNHRRDLSDECMLKENHIAAAKGSITQAVETVRSAHPNRFMVVEVESLEQLQEALSTSADRILLDNFSDDMIEKALSLASGEKPLEVSGNVNERRMAVLADLGVEYASVGSITHSARSVDLSMLITLDMA